MSQASVVVPTAGVVSGLTFATEANAAYDAIRTCWSGSSAPSADAPEQGQLWLDTGTASFPILRQYDGASWIFMLVLDTTNHVVLPDYGPVVTTTGTGAAYVASTSPYQPTGTPRDGWSMTVKIHAANTGAATIAVNGIGAKPLRLAVGVDLTANTLLANSMLTIRWVLATTEWVIDNALAGAAGIQAGTILEYGGFSAPGGYLMADGSAQSRTTYATLKTAVTIAQSGTLVSGTKNVTGLSDTSNMQVGQAIESAHIPASTTIASIVSGTAITISANATGSVTETVTVFPWGNGDGSTTFNVPKRAGLLGIGRDNMSGSNAGNSQVSTNLTTTNGSASATVGSSANLFLGMYINFSTVPYGTTITAISGTSITMSNTATGAAGPSTARFSPIADANIVGTFGGELGHTQDISEIGAHGHTVNDPGHFHTATAAFMQTPGVQSLAGAGGISETPANPVTDTKTTGITINNSPAANKTNNTPKVVVLNYIVKT